MYKFIFNFDQQNNMYFSRLNLNCKAAVGNFTEEQAERVELNPIITTACRHVIERHCEVFYLN